MKNKVNDLVRKTSQRLAKGSVPQQQLFQRELGKMIESYNAIASSYLTQEIIDQITAYGTRHSMATEISLSITKTIIETVLGDTDPQKPTYCELELYAAKFRYHGASKVQEVFVVVNKSEDPFQHLFAIVQKHGKQLATSSMHFTLLTGDRQIFIPRTIKIP